MGESARRALERLSSHKLSEEKLSAWPGTRLAGGSGLVMRYRYDSAVADALGELADGLFDWCAPALPEDLFLTRPSGDVWLGTIAHEKDAYLSLTEHEYAALVREVPEVAGILRLT